MLVQKLQSSRSWPFWIKLAILHAAEPRLFAPIEY